MAYITEDYSLIKKIIEDEVANLGLSENYVPALLASAGAESNFNPNARQKLNPNVASKKAIALQQSQQLSEYLDSSKGGKGFGLFQFDAATKNGFSKWAKSNDISPIDIRGQVQFALLDSTGKLPSKYNSGSYFGLGNAQDLNKKINEATSPEESALIFRKEYIKPKVLNAVEQKRMLTFLNPPQDVVTEEGKGIELKKAKGDVFTKKEDKLKVIDVEPQEQKGIVKTATDYLFGTKQKIMQGDTLNRIAKEQGISVDELLTLNPQYKDNPNLIKTGEKIKIKEGALPGFNEGGMTQEKQMNMFDEGGLLDEGGSVDQESGNEVPSGSLRKEVRDDIPAMLSEGEFVFPADVVRFIGLEKLMSLRQEAKAGLQRMEDMGQMGNSEDATLPDDIPFTIDDLELEEEEPMMRKMQQGGDVYNLPEFQGQQTAGVQPGAGALVGEQQGKTSFAKVRTYRGPDGATLNIPGSMVNGKFVPLYPIPDGYELVGDYVAPVAEDTTVQTGLIAPTTQPDEDRERAIQVKQEEEEMRDRSYEGYVQSIMQNAPDGFDGTFESLLANRDKATFGETGIPMPQFLFNEEDMLKAFNRLKSDVSPPPSKPSDAQRTASKIAGEAEILTTPGIDPRVDPNLSMETDETFGLGDGLTGPVPKVGEVEESVLPPLAPKIEVPTSKPKGRFISTAYTPSTGDVEIERDPNTNEFFFLDENRNRKGSALSPANKMKFGLLDTQVTERIKNPDIELTNAGLPKPGELATKPRFVRTQPDYSTTFDGAFNTTRGGFFFEPDEKQDKVDDPGMEEFTEIQRPSVKQTQQMLDDSRSADMAQQAEEEERQRLIQVEAARKEAEAKAILAQAEAKAAADKAAADKAAAERQAIEAQAEKDRQEREASEKAQRGAERIENITSGVSGAEAGSVIRTREPGGTVKAKEGGKTVKEAVKQVVKEEKQEKEDSGGDDKIVCTAMNNQYGFGSFRQTIWLNQSKTLDKHYQIGYHTIFKPVVRYMYADDKLSNRIVRWWGEGVARRRTADIWLKKKGKRHLLGAVERAILEPLCYIVGKLNGRTN